MRYADVDLMDRIEDVMVVLDHVCPTRPGWIDRDIREALLVGLSGIHGGLDTHAGRRALTNLVWPAREIMSGFLLKGRSAMASAIKVALAIDDVLSGRSNLVSPRARTWVALALDLPPRWYPAADGRPVAEPVEDQNPIVRFAHPWRPHPLGSEGVLGISHSHVRLTVLEADDAPVACSLWTREGRLELRRHGEAWLRPLLAPDGWAPIGLDRFRSAAASGEPWRDSPFLARTGAGRPTFGLWDYAAPRAPKGKDEGRIAQARDACLARAGDLYLVDGVVHRRTGEPMVGLRLLWIDDRIVVTPEWVTGDLSSSVSMNTLASYDGEATLARDQVEGVGADNRIAAPDDFVPIEAWCGAVSMLPCEVHATGEAPDRPWPTMQNLVQVRHHRGVDPDPEVTLRAARFVSAKLDDMLGHVRGDYVPMLDPMSDLLGRRRSDADPRALLAYTRSVCDAIVGDPDAADEPEIRRKLGPEAALMWVYVAALLASSLAHEIAAKDVDEALIAFRP